MSALQAALNRLLDAIEAQIDASGTPAPRTTVPMAVRAHQAYLERLESWYTWLGQDEHGSKVLLLGLIDEVIRRRSPGGEWAGLDEDLFPLVADLNAALSVARVSGFRKALLDARAPIEESALALIAVLDDDEFLTDLSRLPYDEQLSLIDLLGNGLSSSRVGMLFIKQSMNRPLQSPLPLFHPHRIFGKQGSFLDEAFPVMRRAGRVYASVVLNLLKELVAANQYVDFADAALEFVGKYFPEDVLGALTLEEKIDDVRIFLRNNPAHLEQFGMRPAATVYVLLEIVYLLRTIEVAQQHNAPEDVFKAMRSVASVTSALSPAQESLGLPAALKLSTSKLVALNAVTAVYDLVAGTVGAYEAWRTRDLSVAAGEALQGVGLAAAAAASSWTALSAAGALSPSMELNPVAGALLTVGAYVVVFTGTLLIQFTADPRLEVWFEHNYFGVNWDAVGVDESPADPMFKFRRVDGTPDFGRQISELISMFYSLHLELDLKDDGLVVVGIQPALGSADSNIFVKRIEDHGYFAVGPRYTLVPLLLSPVDRPEDVVSFASFDARSEGGKLREWYRSFSPLALSQGRNQNYNATGVFLEIDLTIPGRLGAAVLPAIENSPELMSSFPLTLRARGRII